MGSFLSLSMAHGRPGWLDPLTGACVAAIGANGGRGGPQFDDAVRAFTAVPKGGGRASRVDLQQSCLSRSSPPRADLSPPTAWVPWPGSPERVVTSPAPAPDRGLRRRNDTDPPPGRQWHPIDPHQMSDDGPAGLAPIAVWRRRCTSSPRRDCVVAVWLTTVSGRWSPVALPRRLRRPIRGAPLRVASPPGRGVP